MTEENRFFTRLYEAVERNDREAVVEIINGCEEPEESKQREITYIFAKQVEANNTQMALLLIDNGANVHDDPLVDPPLAHAIWNKNVELVKEMLRRGVETEFGLPTAAGTSMSALDLAEEEDTPANREMVIAILKAGGRSTAPGASPLLGFSRELGIRKFSRDAMDEYNQIFRTDPKAPVELGEIILVNFRFDDASKRDGYYEMLRNYLSGDIDVEKYEMEEGQAILLRPKSEIGRLFLQRLVNSIAKAPGSYVNYYKDYNLEPPTMSQQIQ